MDVTKKKPTIISKFSFKQNDNKLIRKILVVILGINFVEKFWSLIAYHHTIRKGTQYTPRTKGEGITLSNLIKHEFKQILNGEKHTKGTMIMLKANNLLSLII